MILFPSLFFKLLESFVNQLISIYFLAFGGCEQWLNGSAEVGSSSVVAKISSSSSIKRCACPNCLRDDLSDNSRGEGDVLCPVHLSIYSVLPFCLKTRWICNVIVNSMNQGDVDLITDACAVSARLDLVMLYKLNLNAEAHLYFTLSHLIPLIDASL